MRRSPGRRTLAILAVASSLSCSETPLTPTRSAPVSVPAPAASVSATTSVPTLVISQVYGGGGNSGATYTNDFIELFNPGAQPVAVDGWSVQYASAVGSTWQVTALSGTIQPGAYYLVQEAKGAGGTTALPTPDATGSIPMAAGAGKVWLVAATAAQSGTCPSGAAVIDQVSFGTTATDCGFKTTPTLSNTTAALRLDAGCRVTGDLSADFATGAPAPRNAATAVHLCPGLVPVGPLDHVAVAGGTTVLVGSTTQLAALPQDSSNQLVASASITWSSSDPSLATVDAQGLVSGVAASATPVTITATAVDDTITRTGSIQLTVAVPGINWIDVSASSTSFPPGFQAQLFATARTANGGTIIPATFTFEAVDPQVATIATVSNTGLVTAVAPPADGTTRPGFKITATPIGGGPSYTFTTHPITVETPVSAPASIYGDNDEFGDPTPAGAGDLDDLLIVRPQYTISYNASRGTPNWVSYELDARQFGGEDRCNCFTADPLLPAAKQIFTSDYTNGGYDRGHMARSADRTAANVDNATTFYLTNIVPQAADLNQGVWAQFENALGDSAQAGRAVYIVTGPLYSRSHGLTFLKGEGKVAIPDSTWKVAFIGPRSGVAPFTRSSIQSWNDLAGTTVLAVDMPNVAGVRNDPWTKYLTTVDRIEAATGYDILSLLATAFQDAVEAGDHAPAASFAVGGAPSEGSAAPFDASASTDPDLGRTDLDRTEALTYAWTFGDGGSATGKVVSHTFANDGAYTATLTVTDAYGWESVDSQTVTIANVAPQVAPFDGATLLPGETYAAAGGFTDPGADTWTAGVDYGDGGGAQALALAGKTFQLQHTYASAGTFTVTVSVSDGAATGMATATVVVETPLQGIARLDDLVAALGGSLGAGEIASLRSKLRGADTQLRTGGGTAAANTLGAFVNELQGLVGAGQLADTAAAPLIEYARRVIASLGG
ncbi:MAG TPA: DNA/RNA non-specific endonuclease [Longimicrobiales bacterium]|nr:DNA/RNA non-specific endonuclease [Longimicrobiales bacterium]